MISKRTDLNDRFDIAGRGSPEAEAVAEAIVEATAKPMTEVKNVKKWQNYVNVVVECPFIIFAIA